MRHILLNFEIRYKIRIEDEIKLFVNVTASRKIKKTKKKRKKTSCLLLMIFVKRIIDIYLIDDSK